MVGAPSSSLTPRGYTDRVVDCAHPKVQEGRCITCGACLHEVVLNGACYFCGEREIEVTVKPAADRVIAPDRLVRPGRDGES